MLGMSGDRVQRAVGADIVRLIDVERDRPAGRALPRDHRLDMEIFVRQHLEVVKRARHHRADDHRLDVAPRIAFELEQLVKPHRILVGGAARVGGDPPARLDLAAVDQREHQVRVSGIDREQHASSLTSRPCLGEKCLAHGALVC